MLHVGRRALRGALGAQPLPQIARAVAAHAAGMIWVNTYRAVSYLSPFGGYKRSGIGRESGQEMIKELSICLFTSVNNI
ncbi:MAG: aldehyde dehydrogenase family protein [Alphaproteobacteria bacterium]